MRVGLYCLIGLMLGGLGVTLVVQHYRSRVPEASMSISPKDEDVRLNEIHHVAIRDGVKEWILDAKSAHYQKAENRTVLRDMAATFFLKDDRTIHLTGREGVLSANTKDIEVSGDVVARSGPYTLNTERLFYDHQKRCISTESPVVVKGNGVDLKGKGMVFLLSTERAWVRGDVEAVFQGFRLL